uniref:Uncharacterized protein n=1 Tax=Heterorhabditis bacteriophora TaxID=37862 RepID=A0A1I7WTB3_HETBA
MALITIEEIRKTMKHIKINGKTKNEVLLVLPSFVFDKSKVKINDQQIPVRICVFQDLGDCHSCKTLETLSTGLEGFTSSSTLYWFSQAICEVNPH